MAQKDLNSINPFNGNEKIDSDTEQFNGNKLPINKISDEGNLLYNKKKFSEEFLYKLYNEIQEFKHQNHVLAGQNSFNNDVLLKIEQLTNRCNLLEETCTDLKVINDRLSREIQYEQTEKDQMKRQVLNLVAITSTLKHDALIQEETNQQILDLATVTSSLKRDAHKQEEVDQQNQIKTESQNEEFSKYEVKLDIAIKQIENLEKLYESSNLNQQDLSTRLEDLDYLLQCFVRRYSLILENFCPKEDSSAQEMFIVFVKNVLKVNIEEADIEGLHIISKKETEKSKTSNIIPRDRPRPILITFTCYATKARIYRSWLAYRTSNEAGVISMQKGQGLTIREYLSESNEETYQEALKLKETGKILDVWTFKGKTFIKDSTGSIREFVSKNESGNEKTGYTCLLM